MRTVDAREYGIVPGTRDDSSPLAARMLRACGDDCQIVFAPGVYHFYPQQAERVCVSTSNSDQVEGGLRVALPLRGLRNVALLGTGVTLLFHGQMTPFAVVQSECVEIAGFTVDWEIPLVAEGTVLHATGEAVDVSIDGGKYPFAVREGRLFFQGEDWETPYTGAVEFDGATGYAAYRAGDTFRSKRQEALGERKVRFFGGFDPVPVAGNTLVLRHGERLHPGVLIHDARQVTLRGLRVHNTGGLGILAQFSGDLTFTDVRFEPNRQKGRRILSGRDDGIQCSNTYGQVTVSRCAFSGLMDDPLNVHGTSLRVEEIPDTHTVVAGFMHPQAQNFPLWSRPGHLLRLMDAPSMAEIGRAEVADFCLLDRARCRIVFRQALPEGLSPGDALENLTHTPSLTVRDSYFGSCRARGILASTPKPVLIERCLFTSSGCAILLAGDANNWYESGACEEVCIRDNVFTEHCLTARYQFSHAVISVCPEVPSPVLEKPFHGQVTVEGNTFHAHDAPLLYAFSTQKVRFCANRIIRSHAYAPWHAQASMVACVYCREAVVQGNVLLGDVLAPRVHIEGGGTLSCDLPAAGTASR